MKPLLLLAGLWLAAGPAAAQTFGVPAPATLPVAAPAPAPAAPDTLAALHRLFVAKRKKLLPIVAGTVAADVVGVAIIGVIVDGGGYLDNRVIGQALAGILGGAVVGAEVLFYSFTYGKKREQRAAAAFEAHQLPRRLKRQLKPRYFY